MSNLNKAGLQIGQPAGQSMEAGLVQTSVTTQGASGLTAPVPVASTAAAVIAASNHQAAPQLDSSTEAFIPHGGEVFLLIAFALIGMVAIVRRQKI